MSQLTDQPAVTTASAPGPPTLKRFRPSRYQTALLGVLFLTVVFYMWTAATSVPFDFSSANGDVYNLLTNGFLHGHLYLDLQVPSGLLHLANPYDPAQNAKYAAAYHDLSLYRGHFYSQWGPTAAVVLYLPFRITGLRMSESFAVALFASIGLVCAVGLLHVLVRRLVPRTRGWILLLSTVALALGNAVPFLLRRPLFYEVAISSGYCFEMAGLLLVVSAALSDRLARVRLAFGSLCLGLAVGGRPTLAVGGLVVAAIAWWAICRRGERWTVIIPALGPFIFIGACLAWYNHARFGGFTNFGESYELSGIDAMTASFYRLSYIPAGLFSYLLVPARLALTFPHAFLETAAADPFALPKGYAGASAAFTAEPAGGALPTTPILIALLALPSLWRRRTNDTRRAVIAAGGLPTLGLLIATLVSFALFGTTERYEVDFVSLMLIGGLVTWALLLARLPARSLWRRATAVVGVIFILFGAFVGTAISFTGYYNWLAINHPGTFDRLEDITSPLAGVAATIAGRPLLARVFNGPLAVGLPYQGYGYVTDRGASAWLGAFPVTLSIVSNGSENAVVTAQAISAPGVPPPSRLQVLVQANGRTTPVPLAGSDVRLPVRLGWGMNRITLRLAGRPSTAQALLLNGLDVVQGR